MGKVFTITEGLENMGALKTGGQGSVYKGRRQGEIITAVKLLPTPIYSESHDDKNFIDFQNEVAKLKKVNEVPNPHVVTILNSGITDTGNFPYIEMEFIEGHDLGELLLPPYDPVFTIKETIKVAEQLSDSLAHCHSVDVKHGDIKSNNIKFNQKTDNYVLLDFGLAIMSDEQRRTSLRHAGAIEFMAPEQNEGKMLFQTDVYSFGIIIYELLAGIVPFPLEDRGETARNKVMVSHMETPPPDILTLRQKNIPASWSQEKMNHEMLVPGWLISMVNKCLEKNPEHRFANGMELHEYIALNSTLTAKKEESSGDTNLLLQEQNQKHLIEKDELQKSLLKYQYLLKQKDQEIEDLKSNLLYKDGELRQMKGRSNYSASVTHSNKRGVSQSSFIALLLVTALLAAFSAYSLFSNRENRVADNVSSLPVNTTPATNENRDENIKEEENDTPLDTPEPAQENIPVEPVAESASNPVEENKDTVAKEPVSEPVASSGNNATVKYKVSVSRAYFHDEPDEGTRRSAYLIPSPDTITPLEEKNGFIYIIFINHLGQTSRGWIQKKDLASID
ncbi:MAG: serine/threonine protein kinase [Bacteroidota bacterium]|nr:serine/threonine protein kinase [Bacteroidota bacterium]